MNGGDLITKFQHYVDNLYKNFASITKEIKDSREHAYEIAGWVEKEHREKDILIYRITGTDKYISEFSILEIYSNDNILMNFSKKEIKYISTLAIFLNYKKESRYQIVWENFRNHLNNKIIHFFDKNNPRVIKKTIEELENDISFIDELSSKDAFNLGKEMGIRERMTEESLMRECE